MEEKSKKSWFSKIKQGLQKTSSTLTQGIGDIFVRRRLDLEALESLEDLLIVADMGVEVASNLILDLKKKRFDKDVTDHEVRHFLAEIIEKRLEPYEKSWHVWATTPDTPLVILMIGVNGSGKTTTAGKLAHYYKSMNKTVCLAAGDTFRAAAIQQLEAWAYESDSLFFQSTHKDPAGLAHVSYDYAREKNTDILIIDTAGRLHTNSDLMSELGKINRVLQKQHAKAPQETFLVLDGTLGQNSHQQVEFFKKCLSITGLIITKLDGTAKGGALVSIVEKTGLPVVAVGFGEDVKALRPFKARSYAYGLMGLEESL